MFFLLFIFYCVFTRRSQKSFFWFINYFVFFLLVIFMQMNVMEQRWIGSSSRCLTPIECGWNAGMCTRTNCIDQAENRILQKLGPNYKALALWVWPEEITLILYEEEVASSLLPPWKTTTYFYAFIDDQLTVPQVLRMGSANSGPPLLPPLIHHSEKCRPASSLWHWWPVWSWW